MRRSSSTEGKRRAHAAVAVLCAVLAALAIGACGSDDDSGGGDSGGGDSGGTYKIGVLAPITGSLAPYGEALERGVKVAVDLINKDGGIGGKQVEYVLADDQTEPKAATTQARKLLTQDKVDFLMGTVSSATTLAVIPQAEAAKTPYMYVVEGESKTCDSSGTGTRKYIFGNGETPSQKMEKYVPYMLENLGKRVYFIGSDYVFPHFVNDVTKKLVEENGGTVVGEKYAPLGTSEFSSQIAEIKRANPDVVFIDVVGTDGVALVKQMRQFGLSDQVKLTGIPTFAGEVLPGISSVAQGVYTVERYWDKADNPTNKKFAAAYQKQYGSDNPVSTIAAQGAYGSMLLIQAAAESAGSTDRDAITDALPGTKVESPAGEIEINPDNQVVTGPIRLLRIKGNNFEEVEDFGEIPAEGQTGCSSKDL